MTSATRLRRSLWIVTGGLLLLAVSARAQEASTQPSTADAAGPVESCPAPVKQPPEGSPKLLRCISLVFHPDGTSSLDPATYVYYMKRQSGSNSALDQWVPYQEQEILDDFWRLWNTGFLDDLWVERIDEPYENGTPAEHIVYHMEERSRLKLVDYTGSKIVEISKIEEAEKNAGVTVRYDTFVDESVIRKVIQIIKELYADKGYNDATVDVEKAPMPAGPKLLRLTFDIKPGPKFRLVDVQFDGNTAIKDKTLRKQMKNNRPHTWLSFITGSGEYHESKFEEDAERIRQYYQSHGYVRANVGAQQIERIKDTDDGKTREVRLRVPIDEGEQYTIGKVEIAGNKAVKTEFLRSVFDVKPGDTYNRTKFVKGYDKAKEAYGAFGYMEFTMQPEMSFPGRDPETDKPIGPGPVPPIVDVTLRMNEGKQYFVNKITFVGNTTTHDIVVRRDMRLLEGGIFNTEALKESIRRINQLGYFKPIEQEDRDGAGRQDARHRRQGRHHAEGRRAEPQPARLRRRHFPVRGVLRADVVPDGELPRPGRDGRRLRPEGRPGLELPGLVQRAVRLRPADQRRGRHLQARLHLPAGLYAGIHRQQRHARPAGPQLHARVPQLQLRGGDRQGHQPVADVEPGAQPRAPI